MKMSRYSLQSYKKKYFEIFYSHESYIILYIQFSGSNIPVNHTFKNTNT